MMRTYEQSFVASVNHVGVARLGGRRKVRAIWKACRFFRPMRPRHPQILQHWERFFGNESSEMFWLVKADSPEAAIRVLAAEGWDPEATWNTKPWDCTGQWYHSAMDARVVAPGRVLVHQSWRLDV